MIKLLIIDDHPLILEGSKNLFSDVSHISVDTLANIELLPNIIINTFYDVYLIDINLGDSSGIQLAALVKEKHPTSIVILYTGDNIEDYYSLIFERKVNGIISKNAPKYQFLKTIDSSIDKQILLPDNFIDYVQSILSLNSKKDSFRINEREQNILEFIVKGYTNQAIALELNVTPRTIEKNLTHIYTLFNVRTRTEAVLKAKELNFI